jgi:phage terminase large subunit-like protein
VGANAIHQERTASRFAPVSSDAKALDGLNVQVAVCDEIASHKTPEVYDVLLTAMGKRRHPLLLSISTATGNNAGIGRQLWDYAARVPGRRPGGRAPVRAGPRRRPGGRPLGRGDLDQGQPELGPGRAAGRDPRHHAPGQEQPAQEAAAKTRHLNLWVGADEALFSMRAWQACEDRALTLDDFAGQPCHIGLDLARKTDLAAMAIVFPRATMRAARHTALRPLLPERNRRSGARNPSYPGWAARGDLIITPGDETDFGRDRGRRARPLRALRCAERGHRSLAGGAPVAAAARRGREHGGLPHHARRTSRPPSSSWTRRCASGRLRHDGNPVLGWCIGNVVGQEDRRGNLFPTKQRDGKIDAAVALLMAIGRAQASEADGADDITAFLLNPVMG